MKLLSEFIKTNFIDENCSSGFASYETPIKIKIKRRLKNRDIHDKKLIKYRTSSVF